MSTVGLYDRVWGDYDRAMREKRKEQETCCEEKPKRNEAKKMRSKNKPVDLLAEATKQWPSTRQLNPTDHPVGTLFLAYRYDEDCTLKLTTCKVNMWAPSGAFVNVNGEWQDTPVNYVEILGIEKEKPID